MENILDKILILENNILFKYVAIALFLIYILKSLDLNVELLLISIISFIFFKFLIENKSKQNNQGLKKTETILKNLEKNKEFLFIDNNLINFFDYISEFKIYNDDDYNRLISITNNILRLESDINIGTQYCKYDVDTAINLKKEAINLLHSFIHSFPNDNILNEKHSFCVKEYNRLLTKHLNNIINTCEFKSSEKGINTQSFFPEMISNIEGFDPNINYNYNFLL
tara:strand:+ start:41 stop:715 length:675 start_codon:yes stop_codon:yes gene_type:complete